MSRPPSMVRARFWVAGALGMAATASMPQTVAAQPKVEEVHTVTTAAGPQYRAGGLHAWLLGPHYRELWAAPVRVPVLSLDEMAGGLIPLRTGGGMQTRSLRFLAADGREYSFRLIDKDPSALLDSALHGTVVADIVQDGISAAHPYGALVASPLLEAAGVLHAQPLLRVMPDDEALGEFRDEFGGALGMIEERPDENDGGASAFAGARRVIGSEKLMERLEESPTDRVDVRAYLRARLVDFLLGDWDRHRGQWRWATFDDGGPRRWLPIPRDRDQAFSKFDGVATKIAGLYVPQLVDFGPDYPLVRLHWNARALDRRFLPELDEDAWEAVGDSVVRAITDEVIEDAVLQLPPEIHALDGARLAALLEERRDGLPEAWRAFYRMLAETVDVFATDSDDTVRIDAAPSGAVTVSIASSAAGAPYFRRSFRPGETDEIRIRLLGGDDEVVVLGSGDPAIDVRILGGPGDDRYRVHVPSHRVRVYDHQGDDRTVGEHAPPMDRRPFQEWTWSPDDKDQPLDWGQRAFPLLWSSYSSDIGAFIGGGVRLERYGFRSRPYSSALDIRGGFAPSHGRGRLEIEGVVRQANSPLFWTITGRVSGLDVLHYYGLGNATTTRGADYHSVDLARMSGSVGIGVEPEAWLDVRGTVRVERSSTRHDANRFLGSRGSVYGDGDFTSMSIGGRMTLDPLAEDPRSGHRLRVELQGRIHPGGTFDTETTFGRVGGSLSALLASSPRPAASLALRAGAERVFGRFPWHEAAFVGGQETIRGWSEQRFAGDAALYASGELRLRVSRTRRLLASDVGVFGFGDAGRVHADDASPGGWHTSVGGGVYVQPYGQASMARLGIAGSPESTKLFLSVGLPY